MARELRVGVERGAGPPPGYRWSVWILSLAFEEAMKLLSPDQYHHMAMQIKELAREEDPTHPQTASVDEVEGLHELRDKGGILGGINLRVFFYVDKRRRALVVLGTIK